MFTPFGLFGESGVRGKAKCPDHRLDGSFRSQKPQQALKGACSASYSRRGELHRCKENVDPG